ncbi:TonB-dependent receptor [Ramlibacter sp. WS9]|uniref:TonB-dependent receptor n=1 Tax=Ramlibacter sp. WS9 TaxID=1882741 RepID=UPI0011415E8B|nr:TonB-dependent receptor [Ramlibacter sp. WS9]ROZ75361.1 TonB-dependent receptor [Ramlibacter sp. WS9]
MHPNFSRSALGAAIVILCSHTAAQSQVQLKEVTVTGNPLGSELVAPATQYSGQGLLLRSQSTLGETLNNTPGVSSTYFGPNASRPVIRGLDGDRVRILSNSGAALDASSLSYDHAVTADPISVERIEVLRGPGALLYGGNAIGGVVNLIDNRIPTEPMQGVSGKVDLGLASGNREKGAGVLIEGGTARYGLHADVFDRSTQDVRVPVSLGCTKQGETSFARRICNSASDVRGGAVGGSLFFDKGYVGASASTYRSDYGTVAEDEVTIGMKSNRYAIEGELRDLGGWFKSVKAHASHTDYTHTEFDAGETGTVFKNRGNDFRVEARHAKIGALDGVIGIQVENTRFSADGEEAFAPYSRTRQAALFAYEELATSWGKLTFGARTESVKVESEGNPIVPRFVPAGRDFNPTSYALGALWKLTPQWNLTANLAHSERAPKDYELFADGPHVATGAWEVGNADLGKEKSLNADVGLQWKSGHHSFKVNAFQSNFSNYLALAATGAVEDDLPVFAYQQVRARFRGLEAGGSIRLHDSASSALDLELRGDVVRATNTTTGEPLPRIAPVRAGATLGWTQGDWGARLGFDHSARQDRVPAGEQPTDAYTLWSAALTYKMAAGPNNLLWYARVDNAADKLAYSATSILTQTAPGKSPLPGRSFKVGLRASF